MKARNVQQTAPVRLMKSPNLGTMTARVAERSDTEERTRIFLTQDLPQQSLIRL